jgi:hypothetical protein
MAAAIALLTIAPSASAGSVVDVSFADANNG